MTRILSLALVLLSLSHATTFAQNPLRGNELSIPATDEFTSPESRRSRMIDGLVGDRSQSEQPQKANRVWNDEQISTVAYEESSPAESAENTRETKPKNNGADALPGNQRIANVVSKVAINLLFVLCIALGMLLLSKRFLKIDGSPSSRQPKSQQNDLTVIQTLRLDSKTSIRLVQWRSNRFLISCDQNGIQSVDPLNPSFGQTLEELDSEQVDGKLLRVLLDDLESKKAA